MRADFNLGPGVELQPETARIFSPIEDTSVPLAGELVDSENRARIAIGDIGPFGSKFVVLRADITPTDSPRPWVTSSAYANLYGDRVGAHDVARTNINHP